MSVDPDQTGFPGIAFPGADGGANKDILWLTQHYEGNDWNELTLPMF